MIIINDNTILDAAAYAYSKSWKAYRDSRYLFAQTKDNEMTGQRQWGLGT